MRRSYPPECVVRIARKPIVGLAVLLLISWTCLALLAFQDSDGLRSQRPSAATRVAVPASAPATQPEEDPLKPRIRFTKPGPWGNVEMVPIVLELPEAYATADEVMAGRDQWTFPGMDRVAATTFLVGCGVPAEQIANTGPAAWAVADIGCTFEPTDALLLSLTPDVRATVYQKIGAVPVNAQAVDPVWFRVGRVDSRLRGSGLSETSVALLKRLLYPGADDPATALFTDIKPALRAIHDPAERERFLKAVTRKRSMVARLMLDAASDTEALAAYWGYPSREANLRPLLDSLKYNAEVGVETPAKINIATLLPPFVQKRLYRYAATTEPAGRAPDDCFWTAFNFFSETPDDKVHNMAYLGQLLQREYVKIDTPDKLGDVIILADTNGDAFHAANFIADDLVFTKNGMSVRQPWILTDMRDLITQYRMKNPTLTIGYFRKRT